MPRTLFVAFVVLGIFIALAGHFGLFQGPLPAAGTSPTISGQSATPAPLPGGDRVSVAAAQAVEPPVPTATPTPTATPIPVPVKNTNAPLPDVGAPSAVVIDETSGAVLFEKNAHARRAPASITKIVTAIVALERGRLDDVVTVKYDPEDLVDSTVMGVNPGDQLTLEDLLYGLMLPSGNDAALAIANHVAGSTEAFAALMNAKMAALGLSDSHFVNPHGLDQKGHYTSAYDITMIARYAMRNTSFRDLAAARLRDVTVHAPNGAGFRAYTIYNLNRLLTTYKGADGVKIGFTDDALRTIVASATRDGHRVFATVMGSWNLWTDTPPLLDYAFRNFRWPQ